MKFVLQDLQKSITALIRKIGYHYLGEDEKKKEISLVRVLGAGGYPRFHLYLRIEPEEGRWVFNLHLDQKRPVYKGSPAHSGEYDGELIKREAERIKEILGQ